jgi:cholesterol transport system auxiliary component
MTMKISKLLGYGRELGLALSIAASSGCALMSKGEAASPRYFSPNREQAPAAGEQQAQPLELRMGRIEPAAHIEERMAYRVSATELGYYDDRRWTEPPEEFVRRALEEELFERRGFQRVISGDAPTLDVEVLSFEELRQGAPRARLSLAVTLRNDRRALLDRTISVDVPLAQKAASGQPEPGDADDAPALAEAMADALARATRQVAEQVSAQLHAAAGSVAARAELGEEAEPARH